MTTLFLSNTSSFSRCGGHTVRVIYTSSCSLPIYNFSLFPKPLSVSLWWSASPLQISSWCCVLLCMPHALQGEKIFLSFFFLQVVQPFIIEYRSFLCNYGLLRIQESMCTSVQYTHIPLLFTLLGSHSGFPGGKFDHRF